MLKLADTSFAYSGLLVVAFPIMLISICMPTLVDDLINSSPIVYMDSPPILFNDQKSTVKSRVPDTVPKTLIALLFAKLLQFPRQTALI